MKYIRTKDKIVIVDNEKYEIVEINDMTLLQTQFENKQIFENTLSNKPTPLKNYEKNEDFNKDVLNYAFLNEQDKIKKLKALEIIKKEISGCLEFYYDEEHDYGEVWCVQNEEESRVVIASANSKQEYELLKEVLL